MRAAIPILALTCGCLAGAAGLAAPEGVQARSRRAAQGGGAVAGRRAVVAGALASALAAASNPAQAKIEDTNPANNYYFPMAKYRYLPRIFRSWIAVDQLAPGALEKRDWEGLAEVASRLDDVTTALPLYASAVEGSRSTKRKKKTPAQKQMKADAIEFKAACEDLKTAVGRKNVQNTEKALARARSSLLSYRQLAQIDTPDGSVEPLRGAEAAAGALSQRSRAGCRRRRHHPADGQRARGWPRRRSARVRGARLPRRRHLERLLAREGRAHDGERQDRAVLPRRERGGSGRRGGEGEEVSPPHARARVRRPRGGGAAPAPRELSVVELWM